MDGDAARLPNPWLLVKAETFVALLRGINVGGKHCLPMKDLAEFFRAEKCLDVVTFIQSGNVVFRAHSKTLNSVCTKIAGQIAERFGFTAPIVVRNLSEMERVLEANPFLAAGQPEKALHVYFLATQPEAERVATLDPHRSPPDAFEVLGKDVYLCLPNGAGRSKLTAAYFDGKLKTFGTARNWNTIRALSDLMTKAG